MKRKYPVDLFILLCFLLFYNNTEGQPFLYPSTARQPVTDTIFGTVITDEYRWLEKMDGKEVIRWLKLQSDLTNSWIDKLPGRNALLDDYKNLDKLIANDIAFVSKEANKYFYRKTLAGENIGKLYYREGQTG